MRSCSSCTTMPCGVLQSLSGVIQEMGNQRPSVDVFVFIVWPPRKKWDCGNKSMLINIEHIDKSKHTPSFRKLLQHQCAFIPPWLLLGHRLGAAPGHAGCFKGQPWRSISWNYMTNLDPASAPLSVTTLEDTTCSMAWDNMIATCHTDGTIALR